MMHVMTFRNMINLYEGMNKYMFSEVNTQFFYRGYQKLHITMVCIAEKFGPWNISMEDMGYTKTKMNNLKKYYFSEDNLKDYQKQYDKGMTTDQASLYFSTEGESKGDHKKPHCIRGIGVNILRKEIKNIHVFYRSSEISRKFLADIIFFHEFIWPKLNLPTNVPILFHFTNCYVHAKQFPMYFVADRDKGVLSFKDDRFRRIIVENLYKVLDGQEGFGLVRTTNKILRKYYDDSDILKRRVDLLIGKN